MLKLRPFIFFILSLVFIFFSTGFAAVKKQPAHNKHPAKIERDSSKIQVKKFDQGALNKLKADKDFNYATDQADAPSWWKSFWQWMWSAWDWLMKKLFGWVGNSARYNLITSIIGYTLLAASIVLLVWAISKSIGIDLVKLWQGKSKKVDVPYTESLENIHEINFDDEIEKAISQHNYRLAVRLLYLRCLKQLSDTNLIRWQIDKTNSAYIYELTDPEQKQAFGTLTRQFEYVWYGNFSIDQQGFGFISTLFQNFKKQLP